VPSPGPAGSGYTSFYLSPDATAVTAAVTVQSAETDPGELPPPPDDGLPPIVLPPAPPIGPAGPASVPNTMYL